ncbi:MAG: membrane protein insertase YidC, partial [Xanthomonadaceae bacterium]|nr:membrane protein insertase YidC [Xanthomonadaceae bacterium]
MNTRTLLLMLLAFLGFMIYVEWQSDYANPAPRPVEPLPDRTAPGERQRLADLPELPQFDDQPSDAGQTPIDADPTPQVRSSRRIEVETDLLVAFIDPQGGSLVELRLKQFPVNADQPDQPFVLLSEDLPNFHIAQSGLVDSDQRAPNHTSLYSFERDFYQLADNQDQIAVPLRWTDQQGLEVVQTWIFGRDDYVIEHRFEIRNEGEQPWQGSRYLRLQRTATGMSSGMSFTNPEQISFDGAAVYSEEDKFEKLKFKDFDSERYQNTITGGWAGMVQHYFLSAWIPPEGAAHRFTTRLIDQQTPNRYAVTA